MNIYIRYFDDEDVVKTPEEAYDFLCKATGESLDQKHLDQLKDYYSSNANFTKRFKVRPRVYFVAIKTDAETLADFKYRGQLLQQQKAEKLGRHESVNPLTEEREGWYEGRITFKRVVFNVDTGKNEYVDTDFAVKAKAHSPQHLYERICEHLKARPDLDPRSQMPSVKGRNFKYEFLG